jgi:hypothetical protein
MPKRAASRSAPSIDACVNINIDISNMPTRMRQSGGNTNANSSAAAPSLLRANRRSCRPNQPSRMRMSLTLRCPGPTDLPSNTAARRMRARIAGRNTQAYMS